MDTATMSAVHQWIWIQESASQERWRASHCGIEEEDCCRAMEEDAIKGRSQTNGLAEVGVRIVEGIMRTLMIDVETKMKTMKCHLGCGRFANLLSGSGMTKAERLRFLSGRSKRCPFFRDWQKKPQTGHFHTTSCALPSTASAPRFRKSSSMTSGKGHSSHVFA